MYLINDIFNHWYVLGFIVFFSIYDYSSMRKGDEQLKNAIAGIIVPVFSSTIMDADEEKKQKMNKVIAQLDLVYYRIVLLFCELLVLNYNYNMILISLLSII